MQTGKASTQKLFTGTSGWAYPTWKPEFYPKTVSAKKFLEYYGTQLNSVEVNYTFRALPTATQLENWIAATPEDFRFSFKAPQAITHFKRLKDSGEAVALFLDALIPARAAKRMGAVLFQLPPNFKADADRLRDFLSLPVFDGSQQIAFEFRHKSWFTPEIYEVLSEKNAAVCIAENEDLVSPESFTANFSCYRLRMSGGYTSSEISGFAKKFASMAKERETYVYLKHEDEPTGPLAAVQMLQEARRQ